jgi:hypothetical protein
MMQAAAPSAISKERDRVFKGFKDLKKIAQACLLSFFFN